MAMMKNLFYGGMIVVCLLGRAGAETPKRDLSVLVVVGAEGAKEYRERFTHEAELWRSACEKAHVPCDIIGLKPEEKDKSDAFLLQTVLTARSATANSQFWLVLIGHGTFDGREAKFNLRGSDITAPQLADWLKQIKSPLAIIQTASASAPFLKALTAPNRVLISATKSADEVFYTRFGDFFAQAISGEKEADLDRDDQVSLLEAFLWSSKRVERFFETEERLATEHALIEDNGDGVGSRLEAFAGVQPKPLEDGKTPDGLLAHQWGLILNEVDANLTDEMRLQRAELEKKLEALKAQRAKLGDAEYYSQLEALMLKIAKLYEVKS